MWLIPVRLTPLEVHLHADRRLAFQVITAFGAGQEGQAASRVLSRENVRLLVEFHTPGKGLFGRRKIYRTVEWVTPHEPERVDFDTVEGPLTMMRDHIILEDQGGCTLLRYESECGLWGSVAGWLMMVLYVRPLKRRLMLEHLDEMKQTNEQRAKRSRVYPQQPCETWESEGSHDA